MVKEVDYIIVGQGLAGTFLSYFLRQKGYNLLVVDNAYEGCSSMVAAGIINPITGRQFNKSWLIDDILPFAIDTYRKLETLLNQQILQKRNIIKTLNNATEENEWLSRSTEEGYGKYILGHADWSEFEGSIHAQFSWGEITSSYQVNLPLFLKSYAIHLQEHEMKLETRFDYNDVILEGKRIEYKDFYARGIVFCEGHMITKNPWFNDVQMKPVKGEILVVKIDAKFTKNLKGKVYLSPLGENTYWVGSDYQFNPVDDKPSGDGMIKMENLLKELISTPFTVIDHKAGIRPASHNRMPILLRHKHHSNLFSFNGLGTKGSSLGPYFAHKMANFIHEGTDSGVDS